MKLSALNTAIRTLKGAPKLNMVYFRDTENEVQLLDLEISKQSLLAALKVAYPEGKNADTGLRLGEGGLLMRVDANPTPAPAEVEVEDDDHLDDLFG